MEVKIAVKSKKWQMVFTVLVAIFVLVSFSGCATEKGTVAVIHLTGIITSAGQSGLLTSGSISPKLVREYLKEAESDVGVKAIVLRVDSPGGSAGASQEIASEIHRFKETTGKPVVISMGGIAASGGYYISTYADKIIANPSTLTGSIGVITEFIYMEGLLEKLGLELEIVKTGRHKDMGVRPLTDEQRKIMQDITDDLYEQFVAAVAQSRDLTVAEVRELATGQLYTGNQALSFGLVDELGGLDKAVEVAASLASIRIPEIEEYSPSTSFMEKLLGGLSPPSLLPFSSDELLFLKMLEGWHGLPSY